MIHPSSKMANGPFGEICEPDIQENPIAWTLGVPQLPRCFNNFPPSYGICYSSEACFRMLSSQIYQFCPFSGAIVRVLSLPNSIVLHKYSYCGFISGRIKLSRLDMCPPYRKVMRQNPVTPKKHIGRVSEHTVWRLY